MLVVGISYRCRMVQQAPIAMKIVVNLRLNIALLRHVLAEDLSGCALGPRFILQLTEVQQITFGSAKVLFYLLQLCLGNAHVWLLPMASAGEDPSDLTEKRVRLETLKSEYDKC